MFEFANTCYEDIQFVNGIACILNHIVWFKTSHFEFQQEQSNMYLICYFEKLLQQGLSASTLASSFGKVINSRKQLSDYKSEDLAKTLLSAFTYNIAQVSVFYFSIFN